MYEIEKPKRKRKVKYYYDEYGRRRRHYPPTHYKHPCITFRVDVDTKKRLEAIKEKSGKSLGQLVKEALGLLEKRNTPTVKCPECGECLLIKDVELIKLKEGYVPFVVFKKHSHNTLTKTIEYMGM